MRVDCHVHTNYSHDCWTSVSEVIDTAVKRNLDAIAITDHDTMSGVKHARSEAEGRKIEIISGVERTVPMGQHGLHLVCLGVEQLPPNDNADTVITSVHEQGGVVILAHPYRNGTGLFYHVDQGNVSEEGAIMIQDRVDFVEIVNWKDNKTDMRSALNYVQELKQPFVAGSDAHTPGEVGRVITRVNSIEPFSDDPSVELQINGTVPDDLENIPKKLVGHMTRSSASPIRKTVLSIGATVLGSFPGQRPKQLAKRFLRVSRSIYEDWVFKNRVASRTSRVILSRTQNHEGGGLMLSKS